MATVPGEGHDHPLLRRLEAIECQQPLVVGQRLGRGQIDRPQAVQVERADVPGEGPGRVGGEGLQAVESEILGVAGELRCGRGGEHQQPREVEEAPAGGELTGRRDIERAEVPQRDPKRIGCQPAGLGSGEGFPVMVSGAAEEAIGQPAECSRDCAVILGRRGASSEREDGEDEHRATDPFTRSGARGGGHGRHGAPRRQERRERTPCRPAEDRARGTPELRRESRLGFAPLPAGTRGLERAIGMPGSPEGESGPGFTGRNLQRGIGLGPLGGSKKTAAFPLAKRSTARDSGSLCPRDKHRSKAGAGIGPGQPASIPASGHRPWPVRSGLGGATDCGLSGSSCRGR